MSERETLTAMFPLVMASMGARHLQAMARHGCVLPKTRASGHATGGVAVDGYGNAIRRKCVGCFRWHPADAFQPDAMELGGISLWCHECAARHRQ